MSLRDDGGTSNGKPHVDKIPATNLDKEEGGDCPVDFDDGGIPWMKYNDLSTEAPMPRRRDYTKLYYQLHDVATQKKTSRLHVCLRMAEYNEAEKKRCRQNHSKGKDRGIGWVCVHPDCAYRHNWIPCVESRNPSFGTHRVKEFGPHDCTKSPPKGTRKSAILVVPNFTTRQMAPALLTWIRR